MNGRSVSWAALAAAGFGMAVFAVGGPAQTALSATFQCGRTDPATLGLAALAIAHAALFLAASPGTRAAAWYRYSQWVTLPLVLWQILVLAAAYPMTAVVLGVAAVMPAAAARAAVRHRAPLGAADWFAVAGLSCAASLVVAGAVLQWLLYRPDALLTGAEAATAGLIGLAGATALAMNWLGSHRPPARAGVADLLPATLLLFPLLRAKYPDLAFDTTLYKGANPVQFVDWGTANTAIIDHTTLGTAFGEMLNATMLVAARDYSPSLAATLGFLALYSVLPAAVALRHGVDGAGRIVRGLAALSLFALSEAGIAQGTSYNEPLLLALLVLAMLPGGGWPLFAAAAVAVKITALFALPLIVVLQISREGGRTLARPSVLAGALAGALLVSTQVSHNLAYTGRVLGLTDHLASLTDPPSPRQMLSADRVAGDDAARYVEPPRGSLLRNARLAACNLFALDLACSIAEDGVPDHGFHVLPGSRAAVFALILAIGLICTPGATRRERAIAAVSGMACWVVAAGFLTAFAQGRYFLTLGVLFGALILINAPLLERLLRAQDARRQRGAIAVALLLVAADLLPGVMANVGWDCRRGISSSVAHAGDSAAMPEDRFLAELASRYRASCGQRDLPPTIVAEIVDGRLPPYVGLNRVQPRITWPLNERLFLADPARRTAVPEAVIAIAYRSPEVAAAIAGPHQGAYETCFTREGLTILCSTSLAPRGTGCARSVVPGFDRAFPAGRSR